MVPLLTPLLLTSLSIALVALGLSLALRSQGVIALERLVFALGLGMAACAVAREGSTFRAASVLAVAFGALIVGLLLSLLYRRWRLARGGDTTVLIMSYSMMSTLILIADRVAKGKAIRTRMDLPFWAILFPLAITLLLFLLILDRSRLEAALKLCRDSRSLLLTFGVSPVRVLVAVEILAALGVTMGTVGYLLTRENFSLARFESLLIPAFAVSLLFATPRVLSLTLASGAIVAAEGLLLWLVGNSVMVKAYQSLLFLLLTVAPLGVALCAAAFHRRTLARAAIALKSEAH